MSGAGRRIVVTGAAGFVGRRLVDRLLSDPAFAGDRIVACDLSLARVGRRDRVQGVEGDFGHPATLDELLGEGADIVFHLAGVLGGAAEADPRLARRVNIDATLSLMEALTAAATPVRLVFASSIAVFGPTDRPSIDDETPADPVMLYGAQKRMIEVALEQAAARGWIDGFALRLPGIVARPAASAGLKSGFLSDLFHVWADGRDIVLPVSAEGTTWLLSVSACVDAFLHAALLPAGLSGRRAFTLPALHVAFAEVVEALRAVRPDSGSSVTFQPVPEIDAQFGRQPPLKSARADALGFRHDGDPRALVRRTLEGLRD